MFTEDFDCILIVYSFLGTNHNEGLEVTKEELDNMNEIKVLEVDFNHDLLTMTILLLQLCSSFMRLL